MAKEEVLSADELAGGQILGDPEGEVLSAEELSGGQAIDGKPVRAVFTDVPGSSVSAAELDAQARALYTGDAQQVPGGALVTAPDRARERDTAALALNYPQGLALGFGDEAAGVASLLSGDGYRAGRDQARKAIRESSATDMTLKGNPRLASLASLAGGVTSLAIPGLAPAQGAKLLSLGSVARGARTGGLASLGASDADLVGGDIKGSAWDATKGALAGGGLSLGLGLAGAAGGGIARWIGRAPLRKEDRIIDNMTLGAPAGTRDAVMGSLGSDRGKLLDIVEGSPRLEAAVSAKNSAAAAREVASMGERADRLLLKLEERATKRTGGADVSKTLDELEPLRAKLAANPAPESQTRATYIQTAMENARRQWIPAAPEAPVKGKALLAELAKKASPSGEKTITSKPKLAEEIAEELGIPAVIRDPEQVAVRTIAGRELTGKAIGEVYERVGAKKNLYLTEITKPLEALAQKYDKSIAAAGAQQASAIRGIIDRINDTYGREVNGIARGVGRVSPFWKVPAKDAKEMVSFVERQAFEGGVDPTLAKELGRKAAMEMRDALNRYVLRVGGVDEAAKLAKLNERFSVLKSLEEAAIKRQRIARRTPDEAAPQVLEDPRTGKASVSSLREFGRTVTDDDVSAAINRSIESQLTPGEASLLAALDDRRRVLGNLERSLGFKATREASPPTTARSHFASMRDSLAGAMAASAVPRAKSDPVGALSSAAAAAALYLPRRVAPAIDDKIVAFMKAARDGSTAPGVLMALAQDAQIPAATAMRLISVFGARRAGAASPRPASTPAGAN